MVGFVGLLAWFCAAWLGGQQSLSAQEASSEPTLQKAQLALDSGDRVGAQALADEWIAGVDSTQRPDDERLATALDIAVLARITRHSPTTDKAQLSQLAQRSLAIREQLYGADSTELAPSLDVLARMEIVTGDNAAAVRDVERSLQLRKSRFGETDPRLVPGLLAGCNVYYVLGNYKMSQPLCERAVAILQAQTPVREGSLALARRQLGATYSANGESTQAINQTTQALQLSSRAFGTQSAAYVEVLLNLGVTQADIGDYDAAITSYQGAIERGEVLRENNVPLYGGMFNNYGHLLSIIGDYPLATQMLQRAIAAASDQANRGMRLTNLADVQRAEGDTQAAEAGYRRSIDLYAEQLGADSPRLLYPLPHLGKLLLENGDIDGARQALDRAMKIAEKSYGMDHHLVVATLRTLAEIDLAQGQYAQARELIERALRTNVKEFGQDHPAVSQLRALLAEAVYGMGGDDPAALTLALAAEASGQAHVQLTIRALPEREALTYAMVRPTGLATALRIAADHPEADPVAVWESTIGARGLVLEALLRRHRAIHEQSAPELMPLRQAWIDASAAYARLLTRAGSSEADQALLAAARATMESAEHQLARTKHFDPASEQSPTIALRQIAAALPKGTALVAYARTNSRNTGLSAATERYVAFVLAAPDAKAEIVSLGDATPIDALIDAWQNAVSHPPAQSNAPDAELQAGANLKIGAALRAAVWDGVESHVRDAKTVFIVPDGKLLFVNLGALPRNGHYLVEDAPTLHLLNDERELLAMAPASGSGNLLAIGGAEFGAAARSAVPPSADPGADARAESKSACIPGGMSSFAPLPGSLLEARDVADQWRLVAPSHTSTTLTGLAASAAAFKTNAAHKTVLHLATHAFAYGMRCAPSQASAQVSGAATRGVLVNADSRSVEGSALQLAGLAFAGANRTSAAGDAENAGIVTAEEIGTLDLRGTVWAVLSACDTGVGRVLAGEGVLGLRYAFRSAGAHTVIMSLWDADDQATREWMHELYFARLQQKLNTADSVRAANISILHKRRALGLSTHPYYWAPFVAVGDWR
jgi:CHAT domain-containing protein/tetratricopeptide (TPR) repeat protein